MIKPAVITVMASLALSACGQSEVTLKNASVEDVAKAAKSARMLDPGKWAITTKVVSIDMPGLSGKNKAMVDAMSSAMIGKETTVESCITPAMAKAPTPDVFAGSENKDCRFESFTMTGGKMDSVMTCGQAGGGAGKVSIAMKGDYSGSAYSATSAMSMEGGPHGVVEGMGGKMTVTAMTSGKRVGECSAADAKSKEG